MCIILAHKKITSGNSEIRSLTISMVISPTLVLPCCFLKAFTSSMAAGIFSAKTDFKSEACLRDWTVQEGAVSAKAWNVKKWNVENLENVFLNRPIGRNMENDLPADANKIVLRFGKAPFLPMIWSRFKPKRTNKALKLFCHKSNANWTVCKVQAEMDVSWTWNDKWALP